jgi:hypothetical protein
MYCIVPARYRTVQYVQCFRTDSLVLHLPHDLGFASNAQMTDDILRPPPPPAHPGG